MKRVFTLKFGILEHSVESLADALSTEIIAAVLDGKIDLNEVARNEKDVRDRFDAMVKRNEIRRATESSRVL